MDTQVAERVDEATSSELVRLYRAYRISWLNKTYYATLSNRTRWQTAALQVIAAISSSGAFYVLKQQTGYQERAIWFSIVAAACSLMVTYLGLSSNQSEYKIASVSNADIHAEIKSLIMQILRGGTAVDEQKVLAKYLLTKQVSLESKDVGVLHGRLVRRLTNEMNRIFPDDERAWDQF